MQSVNEERRSNEGQSVTTCVSEAYREYVRDRASCLETTDNIPISSVGGINNTSKKESRCQNGVEGK